MPFGITQFIKSTRKKINEWPYIEIRSILQSGKHYLTNLAEFHQSTLMLIHEREFMLLHLLSVLRLAETAAPERCFIVQHRDEYPDGEKLNLLHKVNIGI